MIKKIIFPTMLLLASTIVAAGWDYSTCPMTGMMYGYGSSYDIGWKLAAGLIGIIYFVLASFIFSLVFWFTHNLLNKECKENKTRKK